MDYEDWCSKISNSGLLQLRQLSELKTLICGYGMNITGTALAEMSGFWKQLKKLSVYYLNITDTDMLAVYKNV